MLIVIFLYFLVIFVLLYLFKNKLLHPISLTIFYWLTIVLLSELNHFIFKIKIYHWAIIPIILFLVSFTLGGMIFYYKNSKKLSHSRNYQNTKFLNVKYLICLVIIFSLFGLTSIYVQLKFLNARITSLEDIYKISHNISVLRYSNKQEIPHIGKVFQSFLYAGCYFGGITLFISKNYLHKVLTFFPFLIAMLISFVNGVKMPFLVSIIFFSAAYMSTYILYNKGKLQIKLKNTLIFVLFIILSFFTIYNIQKFRTGNPNKKFNYESIILSYFSSYNVFSLWWKDYKFNHKLGLGKYTVSGIHNLIFNNREPGFFKEEIILKSKPEVKSNVYTIFRAFIEDYSFIGTLLIFFIAGYLFSCAYEKLLLERSLFAHIIYSFFITNLLWSFIFYLATYNTILLSWFIICVFLYHYQIKIIKNSKKIISN